MVGALSVHDFFRHVTCEIRSDLLTRQLYATDASIYQVVPKAVALPKSVAQASAVIRAAVEHGMSVVPRGAGTGLAGGALGNGLIVNLAQYNRKISQLSLTHRRVHVQAGVVLDQLNDYLKPHGLCFGPDVATSSRATLGGMIANNSSGARAPIYGTTIDHVVSVDVVLADGTEATIGLGRPDLPEIRNAVHALVTQHADAIRNAFPEGLIKRWPGFGLDDYLRALPPVCGGAGGSQTPGDLAKIIGGSEGTLAAITGATLSLSPLPEEKGLGIIFFHSVDEAMRATVELLPLKPAAIEHVDRVLFDQTRNQLTFQAARAFLELEEKPCEAFLIVEFYDHVQEKLAQLDKLKLGLRTLICANAAEMALVWGLRKTGLALLTSRKGPAKPVAGIEDVAVRPTQLPEYVKALRKATDALGLEVSFYGHAASGLVHVRPVIDLHRAEDISRYRQIVEQCSKLTREFRGSFAGEHGVGIGHAELIEEHLGPELMGVLRDIKALFDPRGLMNPGKVVPTGRFKIDTHLRYGAGYEITLPFKPALAFAAKDECFVGNLEQCNGDGECLKSVPNMCPTFLATGEEAMSPRGRVNAIRAALDGRLGPEHALKSKALWNVLGACLSCKACKKECPSNVDISLLKAELLHARQRKYGVPIRERLISRFGILGWFGTLAPSVANAILGTAPTRALMDRVLGFASKRPFPKYAEQRFDQWFSKRERSGSGARGPVILWDDCSLRYHEPNVGAAAVRVLESAGYDVILAHGHMCCGRPAFSVGRLDVARRAGLHNVALLMQLDKDVPVVFLEPSCFSMFTNDYKELGIEDAHEIGARCVLFEQFVYDLLEREPDALNFGPLNQPVAVHTHCHAKALSNNIAVPGLLGHVPGAGVTMLEAGCCGMAGAFGACRENYELSVAVAEPLVHAIKHLPPRTRVAASGTSCRQQIAHLTDATAVHLAEILAEALK